MNGEMQWRIADVTPLGLEDQGIKVLIDAHSNSQSVREEVCVMELLWCNHQTVVHLMFGSGNAAMTKTVVGSS